MSFESTLTIHADPPTRAALAGLRPQLAEHVLQAGYHEDVLDDLVAAFVKGRSEPRLVAPAVQALVEWVHEQRPDLRFAAEVGDEPDGDFGDWSVNYEIEAPNALPAPAPDAARWKLIAAAVIALAAVAFSIYRFNQVGA